MTSTYVLQKKGKPMHIEPLSPDEFTAPITVITGGWSHERDRSLLSGHTVVNALTGLGIRTRTIDLHSDRDTLVTSLQGSELAFLAIAGRGGEDGALQGLLETLGAPYTGSGVLSSAVGMNKAVAKRLVSAAGVRVAGSTRVGLTADAPTEADRIAELCGYPVIIKPVSEGGSIGLTLARSPEELTAALLAAGDTDLMAEEYVSGRSISVGILEERDGTVHVLPPLETETAEGIYSYAAKRTAGGTTYHCPARVSAQHHEALHRQAGTAHRALGCRSYSRHDFVVSGTSGAVWLEVNTLPGLSRHGNLARMATVAGLSYEQLLAHIVRGAGTDRESGPEGA
ncbi:D-alanine--D-alanine ligase [Streptomyces sp. NPDC002730]|uniref:D-alanine--D-alanine ligase family protein n=1 Tax=Streptomyces sp. NPDC002730 TaxID=3364662 RepID=UPI003677FB84